MKKLMIVGTALALSFGLAATGCKKKDATENKKPEEKGSAAPAPAPTPPPAPPVVDPAAAATSGVPECDEYLATVEKAGKCANFAPAFDGVKKGAEGIKAGIAGWPALDEAARKAAMTTAAGTCKTASDGVKTTATSLGCTI